MVQTRSSTAAKSSGTNVLQRAQSRLALPMKLERAKRNNESPPALQPQHDDTVEIRDPPGISPSATSQQPQPAPLSSRLKLRLTKPAPETTTETPLPNATPVASLEAPKPGPSRNVGNGTDHGEVEPMIFTFSIEDPDDDVAPPPVAPAPPMQIDDEPRIVDRKRLKHEKRAAKEEARKERRDKRQLESQIAAGDHDRKPRQPTAEDTTHGQSLRSPAVQPPVKLPAPPPKAQASPVPASNPPPALPPGSLVSKQVPLTRPPPVPERAMAHAIQQASVRPVIAAVEPAVTPQAPKPVSVIPTRAEKELMLQKRLQAERVKAAAADARAAAHAKRVAEQRASAAGNQPTVHGSTPANPANGASAPAATGQAAVLNKLPVKDEEAASIVLPMTKLEMAMKTVEKMMSGKPFSTELSTRNSFSADPIRREVKQSGFPQGKLAWDLDPWVWPDKRENIMDLDEHPFDMPWLERYFSAPR